MRYTDLPPDRWTVEVQPSQATESLDFTLDAQRTADLMEALSNIHVMRTHVTLVTYPFFSPSENHGSFAEQPDGTILAEMGVIPTVFATPDMTKLEIRDATTPAHSWLVTGLFGIVNANDESYRDSFLKAVKQHRRQNNFFSLGIRTPKKVTPEEHAAVFLKQLTYAYEVSEQLPWPYVLKPVHTA
jgi:hypothetical protein